MVEQVADDKNTYQRYFYPVFVPAQEGVHQRQSNQRTRARLRGFICRYTMGIPVMSSKDFSGYLLYGMSGRRRVFRDAKNSGEKRSSLYSIPDVRTDTELVGGLTRANLLLDSRVAQ
ncbi:hypothetical protein QYF36_000190 [Acer negundo]|nr:hypothetical protein QYF36_000190 [Acer negundo]